MAELHPYQKEAFDFITSRPYSALFLDMGLGKTLITLKAIERLIIDMEVKAVLIVAPLRVARLTWPMEIAKWPELSWLSYTILHGSKKSDRLKGSNFVYLINYEGLVWLAEELKKMPVEKWPFDMIIWDELTKMKASGTQRFKKVKQLLPKFKRRLGLTGTPAPNGLADLYGQMYVVDCGESLGTSSNRFMMRYFKKDYMGFSWEPLPHAAEQINRAIAPRVLCMTAKDKLGKASPTFETVELTFTKDLEKQYQKLEKDLFVQLESADIEVFNAAALTNKCLQFASGAAYDADKRFHQIHDLKIDALKDVIETHKKPILVAYNFQFEREKLKAAFGEKVEFLGSGLPETKEQDIIKRWNEGKVPMLACHPASAGHGLNLQHGSNILVWLTLNWSLELYAQMNARIDRQGQKEQPIIYHFVVKNTVDELVLESLNNKDKTQTSMVNALKLYRASKL